MARRAGKSIEWAEWVCNPVKGRCPAEPRCEYCYMIQIERRFPWNRGKGTGYNPTLRLDEKALDWKPPAGCLVFCCSTLDLFHPEIEYKWIEETIRMIELNPQANYALLTKWPEEYAEFDRFPKNAWLGTTWDGLNRTEGNVYELNRIRREYGNPVWVSFEPLLRKCALELGYDWGAGKEPYVDWFVLGGDSRPGANKPPDECADMLIQQAKRYGIPVWIKDNYGYEGKYGVLKERPPLYFTVQKKLTDTIALVG